jgi:hypothetical protein
MALDDSYNIIRPGQQNATGDIDELHIEEFTGIVENTLARMSVIAPRIPVRSVRGTSVIQSFSSGKSTIQKITPGSPIDGTVNKFGKVTMTIDTTIIARAVLPVLEVFQTQYDARNEIGTEHGTELAKQYDQTFFIQAAKAGAATANKYGTTSDGHLGASQVTFTGASDYLDPALLYAKLVDLITAMRLKDVDPIMHGVVIAVKPDVAATLSMAELLINSEYKTSDGTSVPQMLLKAHGVPVINSNNFVGGETITSHLLSNAGNSNAYDGDFSKLVATAFAPQSLLAGETIPLTAKVFWDDKDKLWFVDAWRAYGVTPNRVQFSGNLLNP